MADDTVVDDDESKIITKFFLYTCRLLQPREHQVTAAAFCTRMASEYLPGKDEIDFIPLLTGSVAEFYIQPMLSCVGDMDVMWHRSIQLAIPAGYQPPTQLPAEFFSRVLVYEIIDSEYPGYVYLLLSYLLIENTDVNKYYAVNVPRFLCKANTTVKMHGPAYKHTESFSDTGLTSYDSVGCLRCLWWPPQAANWPTRHRNYGWPDSATVHHLVSNGCDVVKVAHRLCRQDEWMNMYQCRLSFSRAEIVLLNSWMPVQQTIYHMLRVFVKTEQLTSITDNSGTKMLSNYHIKTLMLWACELKPRSWWTDDLNVVRICVVLLLTLGEWLISKDVPHYFVNCCNLVDTSLPVEIITSRLVSITESWLSTWFVNNYLQKCGQLCPVIVSRLFDDVGTRMKLQNAVSAVVDWRHNNELVDLWEACDGADFYISFLYDDPLTVRSCDYLIAKLAKTHPCLTVYFTAVAFQHVINNVTGNSLTDELTDVLTTLLRQFIGKRRYSSQLGSMLSLSQVTRLMKVVTNNSRSTVQLIEIELAKAYLYRALRCKDSDSDSIYCLANVYLAVLSYITGYYQTAIDHCTLVTRSQDHSQCSLHVVQGELLPKIDDNVDTILGLSVFYQYVRTAALNQQQQTQHVSVFTTEVFAHYLHIRCLSVMKCRQFTKMSTADEVQRYMKYVIDAELPLLADLLSLKLIRKSVQKCHQEPPTQQRYKLAINAMGIDTSELALLLQQSAVERLTTYRQLQVQKFGLVATIVTTDFEALYAYKRGEYQRSLLLCTLNVNKLLYAVRTPGFTIFSEFIQLLDDDIVALSALALLVNHECRNQGRYSKISQLTLSLYLMTQSQLKLHHSVMSLAQTLDYVDVAYRRHSVYLVLIN